MFTRLSSRISLRISYDFYRICAWAFPGSPRIVVGFSQDLDLDLASILTWIWILGGPMGVLGGL